jgi:hypothetical protein
MIGRKMAIGIAARAAALLVPGFLAGISPPSGTGGSFGRRFEMIRPKKRRI